ncbi:MAG: hypothetical protein JXR12_17770 [Neptunomonas phycophila]|uniref:Bug family tripartite tricarboxylate transporter substrate binding protein n=1 Tax=Neptunomonas phycophila TaxID=1572645 RepID=UPI0030FCE1D1
MNRRQFLAIPPALLAASLIPNNAEAAGGRLLFGYGRTGLGSKLALRALDIFEKHSIYPYRLENVPGRSTFNATDTFLAAAPDGLTILQTQSPSLNMLPHIHSNISYDPLKDLRPLGILGEYTIALTLGPLVSKDVKSIDDFVKWVEENPESRYVGFTQYGSPGHMAQLVLARGKQVAIRPQAYRGTSMMIEDLLDGTLAAGMVITGNAIEKFQSGELRAIAVTSKYRHPGLGWGAVKTFNEQGIPNTNISGWYGWFAPPDMADSLYRPLYYKVQKMLSDPKFREIQKEFSLKSVISYDTVITKRIQNELKYYGDMVKEYRIGKVS